ncbi:MAG TPA: hypothetical protein VME70_13685 [Mycobacteriales bacterium]|nr:hypothetical protein [Mycobacteriales bacterium]
MIRPLALGAAALMAVGSGVTASAASAHAANPTALAEVRALLAEAPVLTGSAQSSTAPVRILRHAPEQPLYTQIVQRERYWTIDESWKTAYKQLAATVPAGLTNAGSGAVHGPKLRDDLKFTDDEPNTLPSGLADAELVIAVAPDGHGKAAIGVFAQAAPQPKRPASEIVPTSQGHARVWVRTPSGRRIRVNTVHGAAARLLAQDFDALQVAPSEIMACPLDSGRREVVRFTVGKARITATLGFCGLVEVTRNGHQLPALWSSGAFANDVAADLGPRPGSDNHKRPATEFVPAAAQHATIVRSDPTDGAKPVTVRLGAKQASRLAKIFDRLRTQPLDTVHCNVAGGPQTAVTFRTTQHKWVAREGACTNVVVHRDGKRLPTLLPSATWERVVKHLLGRAPMRAEAAVRSTG